MHFYQIKQKKMHWNALYLRKRLSHNIMGRHLPPGWPHTSTISMHFLKGGGPPPQTVLLFCALSRRVLMIFWWYFDDILFRFTCQKLPPPADVLLFDPFFWSKTEEIALKCTIPQEKAFPYGRSQKLTPPDPAKKPTEIVFSSSFLKMQIYVYHFLQLLE